MVNLRLVTFTLLINDKVIYTVTHCVIILDKVQSIENNYWLDN